VCCLDLLIDDDDDAVAVELFVERARAVRPRFEPNGDELAYVGEIVHRLDGLPLAIELAAARLHTHEIGEIAAGLDRPLSLLSDGYRTSLRHSSLAAVVAWSYELLSDELRTAFAAVSIFSGPFGRGDAAAVCDADANTTSDALAQLVERSLVIRMPGPRFALLETLRAFGLERLEASGRSALVADRHAARMIEWATDADERIHVPGAPVLAEIDDAIAELARRAGVVPRHGARRRCGTRSLHSPSYAVLRLRPDVLAWSERVIASDPETAAPWHLECGRPLRTQHGWPAT
jgi:predicted ATPase